MRLDYIPNLRQLQRTTDSTGTKVVLPLHGTGTRTISVRVASQERRSGTDVRLLLTIVPL